MTTAATAQNREVIDIGRRPAGAGVAVTATVGTADVAAVFSDSECAVVTALAAAQYRQVAGFTHGAPGAAVMALLTAVCGA